MIKNSDCVQNDKMRKNVSKIQKVTKLRKWIVVKPTYFEIRNANG